MGQKAFLHMLNTLSIAATISYVLAPPLVFAFFCSLDTFCFLAAGASSEPSPEARLPASEPPTSSSPSPGLLPPSPSLQRTSTVHIPGDLRYVTAGAARPRLQAHSFASSTSPSAELNILLPSSFASHLSFNSSRMDLHMRWSVRRYTSLLWSRSTLVNTHITDQLAVKGSCFRTYEITAQKRTRPRHPVESVREHSR